MEYLCGQAGELYRQSNYRYRILFIMDQKEKKKQKMAEIIRMTDGFSEKHLDEEYRELCQKLTEKMGRKRNVPFMTGKTEIWAAGVVYAVGAVNFLFDRSFSPYVTSDEICEYFGTKKSTTRQKSKIIQDMFKMTYYDKEFSTRKMQENNPFSNLVITEEGFIIPISLLRKK